MNYSTTYTSCYSKGCLSEIEVQVLTRTGIPRLDIIGLPQGMIREGKDRISACLHSLGINLNTKRILVSLNPGDIPKEGSHFDLPILMGVLKSLGLYMSRTGKDFYWGEIGLDGSIRSTPDYLAHLLFATSKRATSLMSGAPQNEIDFLYPHLTHKPMFTSSVSELLSHSEKTESLRSETNQSEQHSIDEDLAKSWIDMSGDHLWSSLRGSADQFTLFSLLAIGRHHLLLQGPPGVGKTTWCYALHELLPPLKNKEWASRFKFEAKKSEQIQSLSDLIRPPFEAPHHNASSAAVIGGGNGSITAGAITRAHRGVLFLDEFAEFPRNVLEALREPLETKRVSIARSGATAQMSADIQLLAAMNPCKCGFHCSTTVCTCRTIEYQAYKARISGPLQDRFHFKVFWDFHDFSKSREFEIKTLKKRIIDARNLKAINLENIRLNSKQNPRRQRNQLESFISWCKFYECSAPTQRDQNNFNEFIMRMERPHEHL